MLNYKNEFNAVFIHSFWRSSSTYFLSKLKNENTLLFDEPFHELIQTNNLNNSEIKKPGEGDYIQLHHPQNFEYFNNYSIVENLDNISHHSNVIHNYFGLSESPKMVEYINSIIKSALNLNKLPVLGFTRSPGRSLLLKNSFPNSYNIFLLRDPFDQFISGLQQLQSHNNFYFLAMYPLILWENREIDAINLFWTKYSYLQPDFEFDGTMSSLTEFIHFFSHKDIEFYMRSFLLTLLIAGNSAFSSANIIIHTDILESDLNKVITKQLKESLKLNCDFQDCYTPKYAQNSKMYSLFIKMMEDTINSLNIHELDEKWLTFLLKLSAREKDQEYAVQTLVNNYRKDLLDKREEGKALKVKITYLNDDIKNLNQTIQDKEHELNALNHKLQEREASFNYHLQEKDGEINRLLAKIDELQANAEKSNLQLCTLKNTLEDELSKTQRLNEELINLQNLKDESLKYFQNQIAELQFKIAQTTGENSSLNNLLNDERFETQRLNRELLKLQNQQEEMSSLYRKEILELQSQLSQFSNQSTQLEHNLIQVRDLVKAMETSKFWKMRKGWFRLRKLLGIPGD